MSFDLSLPPSSGSHLFLASSRLAVYDFTAYSSIRIHHQTHRIVLPCPLFIPLSSPATSSTRYSIPLDVLRIPGWLPSTFYLPFSTLTSSVSATVEVVSMPTSGSNGSRLSGASRGGASSEGKTRFSSSGEKEVVIERLRVPKPLGSAMVGVGRDRALVDDSGFNMRHFSLKTDAESPIE